MAKSEEMRRAGEKLLQLSADEEAQEIAQAREESQWAWQHTLYRTEERAREEGIKQGAHEKSIEIAKKLLGSGVSREIVQKASGLDIEEIQALEREVE